MELKLKDIKRYKELYCSLCYAIRTNYGQVYGMALSYDITFLLVCLNSFSSSPNDSKVVFRCPTQPWKKYSVQVSQEALHYSAFINYYLTYLKLDDDSIDDHNVIKKMLSGILRKNKNYVKLSTKYNNIAEQLKGQLNSLYASENIHGDFDELSNIFGSFFSDIFVSFLQISNPDFQCSDLSKLCLNLGKWIYLMDAYDDYLDDTKKNRFNLLATLYFPGGEPTITDIHNRISKIVSFMLYNMKQAAQTLSYSTDRDIIENIIEFGCMTQYTHILQHRYPEYYATLRPNNKGDEACEN